MLVGAVMGFWAVQRVHGRRRSCSPVAVGVAALAGATMALIHAFLVDHAAGEPDRLGARADDLRGRRRALVVPRQRPQPRRRSRPSYSFGVVPTSSGCTTCRSSARSSSTRRRSSTRRGCASRLVALYLDAHAAGPERARGRRVAGRRGRDGDQRHRVPLRAHARRRCASRASAAPCFSLSITPQWVDGLTAGAGWIAIALVIFAFWRPALCLVGAYFFGAFSALPFTLQARGVDASRPSSSRRCPYVMTIVVLVPVSAPAPAAGSARRPPSARPTCARSAERPVRATRRSPRCRAPAPRPAGPPPGSAASRSSSVGESSEHPAECAIASRPTITCISAAVVELMQAGQFGVELVEQRLQAVLERVLDPERALDDPGGLEPGRCVVRVVGAGLLGAEDAEADAQMVGLHGSDRTPGRVRPKPQNH